MTVRAVGFVGRRIADPVVYAATVGLFRDLLGIKVVVDDERSARFRLPDGTALHVYGPGDLDHVAFGDGICLGFEVDDVDAARRDLEAAGFSILDAVTERDGKWAWFHYLAPDGTVQELIGPDPAPGGSPP